MKEVITRLLQLFEESIVLQGFITVAFIGTYCAMVLTSKPVPTDLAELTKYVLIFWFGTKSQAAVSSTLRRLGNGRTSPNFVDLDSHSDS